MKHFFISVTLAVLLPFNFATAFTQVHYNIMTHKDQSQKHSLSDSLRAGTGNIEMDIHWIPVYKKFLVGHNFTDLRPTKTLESMYLTPLSQMVAVNGSIYPDNQPLNLYLDIKSSGETAFKELNKLLKSQYANLVSHYENGQLISNPVNIVITGNRDWNAIKKSEPRYVFIDGRTEDINDHYSADLVPMISQKWEKAIGEAPTLPLSANAFNKLKTYCYQTAEQGQYLRFWATPDNEAFWKALLSIEGCQDTLVINTEKPKQLGQLIESL